MFIRTEDTPNPSTLKFIPGVQVMPSGTAAYAKKEDCGNSPLAAALFECPYVAGVFLGSDFITVTKTDAKEWDLIKAEILAIIMDHFVAGGEVITDDKTKAKSPSASNEIKEDDDEIVKQIKSLIEERIRPAVAMDGGDIVFNRFEDGVLYLEMHGACSGCPSSTVTLKNGIENMMQHYVPEVVRVEAAD